MMPARLNMKLTALWELSMRAEPNTVKLPEMQAYPNEARKIIAHI